MVDIFQFLVSCRIKSKFLGIVYQTLSDLSSAYFSAFLFSFSLTQIMKFLKAGLFVQAVFIAWKL